MSGSPPVATSVQVEDDLVTFRFQDGHQVTFEAFRRAPGFKAEGLHRFTLSNEEGRTVVQYDARLTQMEPNPKAYRFVEVDEDYTIERIVGYWEQAREYLDNEYIVKPFLGDYEEPIELEHGWFVLSKSMEDLHKISQGLIPLPAHVDH
jgi:hypothetical protein